MIVSRRVAVNFVSALLIGLSLSISALAQAEQKPAYGILIDNTGSLRSQFDLVINLGKGIVDQTHQKGPVSFFNFKPQAGKGSLALLSSGTEWSQDRSVLNRYLDSMFVVGGQTTLIDGINSIAEQLNAKASIDKDLSAGKIIFLITDGEDRSSKINDKALIKRLKESGIKVYAIGLVNELDSNNGFVRKGTKGKAVALLEKPTKETGGRAVFTKSKNVDAGALLKGLFAE